jgi:arginine N-succinyltransferase
VLPIEAQRVIGEVGPQTKGVERLLERIGFRYCERVDPFDGGPHFLANTDEITLVQDSTRGPLVETWPGEPPASAHPRHRAVVATQSKEPPFWNSVMVPFDLRGDGIVIQQSAADAIGAKVGDEVMFLPIHPPVNRRERNSQQLKAERRAS